MDSVDCGSMAYDFDSIPDRRGTGSLKWERYAGKDILPFWVADMDFHSAPEIQEALQTRLNHGVYGYTLAPASTVEAVQGYLKRTYQWEVPTEQFLWLPGLVPALNIACRAYCEAGEEVAIFSPVYPPFRTAPGYAGRGLLEIPLLLVEDRWTLDLERLETSITDKTRLLILCNPHNPGGTVFTKEELLQLGEICIRHDLIVCSDEIHCDLILDSGQKHVPFGSLSPELAERSITLMAPSKTYNLPGLACAFGIFPNERVRNRFMMTARGLLTEVNLFGYAGCEAAYNHGEPWRLELIEYLRGNRDELYRFLGERYPQIGLHSLPATYLAWLDVSQLALKDPAAHFEKHGIALSDGKMFGGERFLRLNFGCPRSRLEEGLTRLARGLDAV